MAMPLQLPLGNRVTAWLAVNAVVVDDVLEDVLDGVLDDVLDDVVDGVLLDYLLFQ